MSRHLLAVPVTLWIVVISAPIGLTPFGRLRFPEASAQQPPPPTEDGRALARTIQQLEIEAEQRRAFVIARGRTLVRLLQAGLLPLSGGFEAMTQHASHVDRLRRAIEHDLERLRGIAIELEQKHKVAQRLASFDTDKQEQLTRARNAIAAARERDDAFQRAFGSASSAPDTTAIYGGKLDEESTTNSVERFGALRGKLPLPVAGRVELSPAPSHAGGGRAARLTVAPGATVRCMSEGRVAFAGEYPDLGQTVIIDHGDNFYAVLSGLSALSVRAGDELQRGEPLGHAGATAGRGQLTVELRHKTEALDTPQWFGL